METVIGVDLGTQTIKTVLYDPSGKTVLQTTSHPLSLISRDDGTREQRADWWLDGLRSCITGLSLELRKTVVAIGVSGQQHGFVAVDVSGTVLAPVKLWCDTATVNECDRIMAAVGGEKRCVELTGQTIAAGYTASKILWLKSNIPEAYNNLATVLLPHDYLNFYLTGQRNMEYGDASGTGLLDIRNRCWQPELIDVIDPDLHKCLPDLIQPHQPTGKIRPEVAAELGLSEAVLVSAGGGDNMMAAIGTGNVVRGKLTASLGTSGTLFGYADTPIIDPQGDLAAFCSSCGGWLPLLCTMNCTVATEQLRNLFDIDIEHANRLAEEVPAGADGVITLPFYNGERTPSLPNGKACVFGLDIDNTTQSHLLRSAMESAVFGLKTGLVAFERCGMNFEEVTLTGGGADSPLWRQMCADILDLPVKVSQQQENAAFGAAIQALWCYRCDQGDKLADHRQILLELVFEHIHEVPDKSCEPDQDNIPVYEEVYKHYSELVDTMTPLYQ